MIYAETDRLILRQLEQPDIFRIITLLNEWDVAKHLTNMPHGVSTQYATQFFEKYQNLMRDGAPAYIAIADRVDNTMIGGFGVEPSMNPKPQICESSIGYWVGKPYWEYGVMGEAIDPLIDETFRRSDRRVLTAHVAPNNEASLRVLNKVGFRYLGTVASSCPSRSGPVMHSLELHRKDYYQLRS